MERVEENKAFLETIMSANITARKSLIKTTTEENIKILVEVCVNINSFPYTKNEQKDLKKVKPLLLCLIKFKRVKLELVRKLFVKYNSVLPLIISTVLTKITEGAFCKFLNEGEKE